MNAMDASQLLTNPSIMFCDEPTSGLDSFMALQVISVLKDESRMGKTIISTIHQPSSQVFELFDIIYLMGEGRVVFAGPPAEAVKFFERVGYPSPGNFNPADHYIRTLAIVPKRERQCRKRVRDMSSAFKNSAEGTTYSDKAASDWDSGSTMAQSAIVSIRQQTASEQLYKATWLQQVTGLVKRSSLSVLRDPLLLRIRLYQALVLSVLTGAIYVGQTRAGSSFVMNMNGVLFQLVTNMTFNYTFSVVETFGSEITIFMREHLSGVYRVDAYFLSKIVAEIYIYTILPGVFTTILYWMSGLYPSFGAFLICLLISVLTANVGISIGYAVSCSTGDLNLALAILPVIIIPSMLLGGFYLNDATIPAYFNWIKYLSFMRYSYEGLMINQWNNVPSVPGCANSTFCPSTGIDILDQYNFESDFMWQCVGILAGMIVIWRSIAFWALFLRASFNK